MHTITIFGEPLPDGTPNRREFQLPGSWEELTTDQLGHIARILTLTGENAVLRFLLLEQLAGIPPEWMAFVEAADVMFPKTSDSSAPFAAEPGPAYSILPCLDWCFAPPVSRKSHLPSLTIDGLAWEGPEDRLFNFTLSRFAHVDSLLSALAANQDEAHAETLINNLIAALYVPAGYQWTTIPVELKATDARAQCVASIPQNDKLAAILNYRALRGHLAKTYWRVFEGGDEEPFQAGLFGTIYDVCASGIFGDIDNTEKQSLFRVMGYMQHQLEKDERNAKRLQTQPT